jgi:hypothetical protein
MRRLEKLTGENNKIRRKTKGKKTKGGSSPRKGRMEETIAISLSITQCLSIMIIYLALPLTLSYTLANPPTLMELVIINGSIK